MAILLSIITINFNNVHGIKKTFDSVFSQSFREYEHIVIDGGSTDGSKEIIELNASKFSYFVSEIDKGIYNAMNKGLKQATGKYVLFLNSGDYLFNKNSIESLINNHENRELIYGNIFMHSTTRKYLKTHPTKISFEYFLRDSLPHSATLIKKELFNKVGYYNEQYKIVSDWEFFMNAICLHNCTYKNVDFPISVFIQDGISSNPNNEHIITKEKQQILFTTYSAFLEDYERLKQYSAELNNIKNSRIHKLVNNILNSSFYKKIKIQINLYSKKM